MNPLVIAVLDINVFVSGTTPFQSYPAQILNLWKEEFFILATSEPILQKMRLVYLYPQIAKITHKDEASVDNFLNDIRKNAIVVPGKTQVNVCKDPEDNQLFSCALEANADYVVSGDKKHVLPVGSYKGIRAISPKNFVEEILTIEND